MGRQASEQERERLYRLRDALGLRDNDAFWSIVMALEHYDSFFRHTRRSSPSRRARCIESARAAFAVAAEKEAAQVQRMLSEKVAETSVEIARKLAEQSCGPAPGHDGLGAVVAFGALCVTAGYSLAAPEQAFLGDRRGVHVRGSGEAALGSACGTGRMDGVRAARSGRALRREGGLGRGRRRDGGGAGSRRRLVHRGALRRGCVACAVMLAKVT